MGESAFCILPAMTRLFDDVFFRHPCNDGVNILLNSKTYSVLVEARHGVDGIRHRKCYDDADDSRQVGEKREQSG